MRPKHLVVATGLGKPRKLDIMGIEKFGGRVYHAAEHRGAEPFRGKRAVILGSVRIPSKFDDKE